MILWLSDAKIDSFDKEALYWSKVSIFNITGSGIRGTEVEATFVAIVEILWNLNGIKEKLTGTVLYTKYLFTKPVQSLMILYLFRFLIRITHLMRPVALLSVCLRSESILSYLM